LEGGKGNRLSKKGGLRDGENRDIDYLKMEDRIGGREQGILKYRRVEKVEGKESQMQEWRTEDSWKGEKGNRLFKNGE
jgi:hypothetical protein